MEQQVRPANEYRVLVTRYRGWWDIEVPTLGVHAQSRLLRETEPAARAAISSSASDRLGARVTSASGNGSGAGRVVASDRSRAARRAASRRSVGSGVAAAARTSASGPSASCPGRAASTLAIRVATVVSAVNGTTPVIAS